MKQFAVKLRVLMLLALGFSSSAQAGEPYWLVDLGLLFKSDSTYEPDMLTAASVRYGYGFNANLAFEVDYTHTLSGGAFERDVSTLTGFGTDTTETGEFSVWMTSLGFVYRHLLGQSFYIKGKLAYNYSEEERTSSAAGQGDYSVNDSIALGLGGGFLLGEVVGSSLTIELDYRFFGNDYSGFMLGANATF